MHDTLDASLALADDVTIDTPFSWTGRIVVLSEQYMIMVDVLGRLARTRRDVPSTVVTLPEGHDLPQLLSLRGVREALLLAKRTLPDPADYDRWMIPLRHFACDQPLTPLARQYMSWPAVRRRQYEGALEMMPGPRQREVLLEHLMGNVCEEELRRRHNLRDAAIRTAKWRARRYLTRYVGDVAVT